MSVESDIYDALSGLVAGRVYPDIAPFSAAVPQIVYQQISGTAVSFLESGKPSKKNGRFQIRVWSLTRAEATTIARAIEDLMVTSSVLRAEPMGGAMWDYDDVLKWYGTLQDFSIWFDD